LFGSSNKIDLEFTFHSEHTLKIPKQQNKNIIRAYQNRQFHELSSLPKIDEEQVFRIKRRKL